CRIGIKSGRKRSPDATNNRPVVQTLAERDARHHAEEQHQPVGPWLAGGFAVGGLNRFEKVRPFNVRHGSSSSRATRAKCPSPSAVSTAARAAGCQCGARSLAVNNRLTPS